MPTADLHQELRQAQAELDQLLRAELDLQRKEKELRVHVIDLHARMRQDHTQDANDLVSVQTLRDTFPRPAKYSIYEYIFGLCSYLLDGYCVGHWVEVRLLRFSVWRRKTVSSTNKIMRHLSLR